MDRLDELEDDRFGFPILLRNVPVREVRGQQTIAVNANTLRDLALGCLVFKLGPLTGHQVRFIRLHMEKTLAQFGELCGVSHVAVHKWEAFADEPTKMGKGTEFFIRIVVMKNHLLKIRPVCERADIGFIMHNMEQDSLPTIELDLEDEDPAKWDCDNCGASGLGTPSECPKCGVGHGYGGFYD